MMKSCKWMVQFFKFGMVGVANTAIGLGSYYVFLWLGLHYQIANICSWLISVYNAFYWNNKYVFKNNAKLWHALIKTYISYGASLIAGMIMLWILVEKLYISELIAPLCTLLLTIPLNFFMNKFWTFRSRV